MTSPDPATAAGPDPVTGWAPANEQERALCAALAVDDRPGYFRLLATNPLYLPVPPGTEPPAPQQFLTRDLAGRTYLVVYTSPETLAAAVGDAAVGYAVTGYPELRDRWPDPEWWLAVNPGLPIDCLLDVASLGEAAEDRLAVPTAAELVAEIARDPTVTAAVRQLLTSPPGASEPTVPRPSSVPDTVTEHVVGLLRGRVLVPTAWPVVRPELIGEPGFPWRPEIGAEPPTIALFTTPELLASAYPDGTPSLLVPFSTALLAWPDPSYALWLDPDGPLPLRLDGPALEGLLALTRRVVDELS
jgi:hypothetical protein